MQIEVTERIVDKARVVATFNTKIAPSQIEDYLFLVGASEPTSEAKLQAQQYFAQGHEVNFVYIKDWILMLLSTTGKKGREIFNSQLMSLLDAPGIPQALKVSWNEQISNLVGV